MRRSRFGYSRRRVAELRDMHPDWTLEEIGEDVGVTRERVRQLLSSESLRTTAYPRRYRWSPRAGDAA